MVFLHRSAAIAYEIETTFSEGELSIYTAPHLVFGV